MEIVLNTYGTSLSCDNDAFIVRNSNGSKRIPTDGVTSIMVNRGVSLSSDVIMLAVDKQIQIHFMDRKGMPKGLIWSYKYGSISTIRKNQLEFCNSTEAVKWIKSIINRKLDNAQALLYMVDVPYPVLKRRIDNAIIKLDSYKQRLRDTDGEGVKDISNELRGIEGVASRLYFNTLNLALPEEYRFEERSQHPALDVANAMLNYGYGIMYGKVESALIRAGLDPYLGVLHRNEYNRPALAFDMIELFRVWVDYVVYTLLAQRAVTDDYYSVDSSNSAHWLEPMGRRVLIQSINDYLDEVIDSAHGPRSRETLIFLECQSLAQLIKSCSYTKKSIMSN